MSGTLPIVTPASFGPTDDEFDLVEMLLAEQQSLTAVERFSALHDEAEFHKEPAQSRYYRDLLPATPPGPGQQFAFSVDLDSCSGCKACVVACHTMNGLEEQESWRRVGTIVVGDGPQSRIQHVTTACHHCEEPGCLNGCPVKAYEKDPATGVVRHLDDQCIGCKYCTMMCPYEVPQYSDRLGIVRKCDMCHQRLSAGEAPACVQSCPNEAIAIKLVDSGSSTTPAKPQDRLAPGAPLSTITCPTTTYATDYPSQLGGAIPQDAGIDEVAESHWPLALMLVATQVSVGMLVAERSVATLLWFTGSAISIEATRYNAVAAFVIAIIGLNVAALHLGQPLRAWRVFLGLKTSWLSREAVVLGKYMGALATSIALLWMPEFVEYVPAFISDHIPTWAAPATLVAAILLGSAGLFSSAMIYIATKRQLWRPTRTLLRFFGTAVVAGLACSAAAMIIAGSSSLVVASVLLVSIGLAIGKLSWEFSLHLKVDSRNDDPLDHRSRRLVNDHLSKLKSARLKAGMAGIVLLALALVTVPLVSSSVALGLVLFGALSLLVGESCERLLYFMSVVYDRMPGTLR